MIKYFKWLASFWKKRPLSMIAVLEVTILTIIVKTAFPLLLKYIVDYLGTDYDIPTAYKYVYYFMIAAVFHEIMSKVLPLFRGYLNMIFAQMMRNRYYRIFTGKAPSFFKKFRTGDLLTRLTDDIDGGWDRLAWYSCSGILRPVEAISVLIFTLGTMMHFSVPLTLVAFIPLPFLVLILAKTEDKMMQYTILKQKSVSRCNNILEACFSGIRVVKTTLSEQDQLRKYEEALSERVEKEKDFLKINQIIQFWSMLVNHAGSIIVIFVGSYFMVQNKITLGTFLLFITFMQRLIEPIWTLSWFYASSKQVFRYVDRLMATEESDDLKLYDKKNNISSFEKIEVNDLSYQFEDGNSPVLQNINFAIEKGKKLAIVGQVGSGKTTLLELIAGNLQPTNGLINLNNKDIHTISMNDISREIGYIQQENILFSETILGNLELGNSFSTNEVNSSLRISLMEKETEKMPKKIHTKLGQRGLSLSGGQKQRLAIARTLIRKPNLLLLDDVTAAMDAKTEKMFWDNLNEFIPEASCILVTHRMATAKMADEIIVIENGKIVERGNHENLISNDSLYKQIMQSHISEDKRPEVVDF